MVITRQAPSAAKARVVNRTPNVHESWGFVRFRSAEGVEIWFQNGGNYGFMFDLNLYRYILIKLHELHYM